MLQNPVCHKQLRHREGPIDQVRLANDQVSSALP
jgi:hypothetical protein